MRWGRFAVATLLFTLALAALTGIPTDLVPTPYFTRMTAIQGYAYPVWVATALLGGLLGATYVAARDGRRAGAARRAGGGGGVALAYLAVGCPVCNKLVVLALGFSGALTYFAPLQPILGGLSLASLGLLLAWRLRELRSGCPACPAD